MKLQGTLERHKNWWIATIPALDVASQGKTQTKAIYMVLDALSLLVEDLYEEKLDLHPSAPLERRFSVSTSTPWPILCFMVKRMRLGAGVSIRELAKRVGTKGANTVAQYERGIHEPSFSKLNSFIEALGRDIELNIVDP